MVLQSGSHLPNVDGKPVSMREHLPQSLEPPSLQLAKKPCSGGLSGQKALVMVSFGSVDPLNETRIIVQVTLKAVHVNSHPSKSINYTTPKWRLVPTVTGVRMLVWAPRVSQVNPLVEVLTVKRNCTSWPEKHEVSLYPAFTEPALTNKVTCL